MPQFSVIYLTHTTNSGILKEQLKNKKKENKMNYLATINSTQTNGWIMLSMYILGIVVIYVITKNIDKNNKKYD